ncbi:MAG: hypothetical protein ACRDQA_03550 [Nocardioidaceae bacterium]
MRWYAQDTHSGDWLHRDVPLVAAEPSIGLGGSGGLRASIEPEFAALKDADGRPLLREWGAFLFGEEHDQIACGYILIHSELTGQKWEIEGQAFASYPNGYPFGGTISERDVDPLDVVRELWGWLQSQPDSDLGLELAGTKSTVRLGTGVDDQGNPEPYTLDWWNASDIGDEINQLAGDTPFDFREVHLWQDFEGSPKETVRHVLQLGFPRVGSRKRDLRFVEGENVADVVAVTRSGEDYANDVLVLGAGEGRRMARGESGQRDGNLRRVKTVTDKSIHVSKRAHAYARELLAAALPMPQVASCVVVDHPNAPFGSFAPGDDVLVHARVGWADLDMWHRITEITMHPDDGTQELTLVRSDAYIYDVEAV